MKALVVPHGKYKLLQLYRHGRLVDCIQVEAIAWRNPRKQPKRPMKQEGRITA